MERMVQLKVSQRDMDEILKRMHFGTTPAFELGNWIPDLLKEWRCEDHNCGYYQAVFQMETSSIPLSLSTLDCLMHDQNCAGRCECVKDDQTSVHDGQGLRFGLKRNHFLNFAISVPVLLAKVVPVFADKWSSGIVC